MSFTTSAAPACGGKSDYASCFMKAPNASYFLSANLPEIHKIYANGEWENLPLKRKYKRIAKFSYESQYAALSQGTGDTVYFLDKNFCETHCLTLRLPSSCLIITDISILQNKWILLIAQEQVLRYNLNGDFMGVFMESPCTSQYKGICTYDDKLYLSYVRSGCLFAGIYTAEGEFIDQICLGSDYTLISQYTVSFESEFRLELLVKRDFKHLCIISIAPAEKLPRESEICARLQYADKGAGLQATIFVNATKEQSQGGVQNRL